MPSRIYQSGPRTGWQRSGPPTFQASKRVFASGFQWARGITKASRQPRVEMARIPSRFKMNPLCMPRLAPNAKVCRVSPTVARHTIDEDPRQLGHSRISTSTPCAAQSVACSHEKASLVAVFRLARSIRDRRNVQVQSCRLSSTGFGPAKIPTPRCKCRADLPNKAGSHLPKCLGFAKVHPSKASFTVSASWCKQQARRGIHGISVWLPLFTHGQL